MSSLNHQPNVFARECPSRSTLRDVTGRWGSLIILTLDDGMSHFGEIHRHIDGSNERMIAQTLNHLIEDGMVIKTQSDDSRPVYSLTPAGQQVAGHLKELIDVIYDHIRDSPQASLTH